MPSGIGTPFKGKSSQGKHLSTGSEYPDSPCGAGSNLVETIEEVTCPACIARLRADAKEMLAQTRGKGSR